MATASSIRTTTSSSVQDEVLNAWPGFSNALTEIERLVGAHSDRSLSVDRSVPASRHSKLRRSGQRPSRTTRCPSGALSRDADAPTRAGDRPAGRLTAKRRRARTNPAGPNRRQPVRIVVSPPRRYVLDHLRRQGQVVAAKMFTGVPVAMCAMCDGKAKFPESWLMWQWGPPNVDWSARFSDGCPDAAGAAASADAATRPTMSLRMALLLLGAYCADLSTPPPSSTPVQGLLDTPRGHTRERERRFDPRRTGRR